MQRVVVREHALRVDPRRQPRQARRFGALGGKRLQALVAAETAPSSALLVDLAREVVGQFLQVIACDGPGRIAPACLGSLDLVEKLVAEPGMSDQAGVTPRAQPPRGLLRDANAARRGCLRRVVLGVR